MGSETTLTDEDRLLILARAIETLWRYQRGDKRVYVRPEDAEAIRSVLARLHEADAIFPGATP